MAFIAHAQSMSPSRALPSGIALCAALACLLLSSYVLNASLFPAVAQTCPVARELSTYFGAAGSIVFAVVAYRKPSIMAEDVWSGICLAFSMGSVIALYLGISIQSSPMLVIGSPFGGISCVWFSVLMGVALTNIGARRAGMVILSAFLITYGVHIVLDVSGLARPLPIAAALYFALLTCSYALMRRDARAIMRPLRDTAAPTVLTVTSPSSYLPISNYIYVSILLFNIACGYSFASLTNQTLLGFMASCAPVIALLCLAGIKDAFPADSAYRTAVLLVFAGFLFTPLPLLGATDVVSAQSHTVLLNAGTDCFTVVMYYLIASVGARNKLGAVSTSAIAFAAQWVGVGTGALIAQGIASAAQTNPILSLWATFAMTFAFMAYNYVALRRFSFTATIESVVPAHEDAEFDANWDRRPNDSVPSATKNAAQEARPDDIALPTASTNVLRKARMTTPVDEQAEIGTEADLLADIATASGLTLSIVVPGGEVAPAVQNAADARPTPDDTLVVDSKPSVLPSFTTTISESTRLDSRMFDAPNAQTSEIPSVQTHGNQNVHIGDFDEACDAVAYQFGLTSRELDVLKLLARGRTSPFIQEKLVLSHNTVKTHVRHIYTKLNVHSQQELISIVEGERGR